MHAHEADIVDNAQALSRCFARVVEESADGFYFVFADGLKGELHGVVALCCTGDADVVACVIYDTETYVEIGLVVLACQTCKGGSEREYVLVVAAIGRVCFDGEALFVGYVLIAQHYDGRCLPYTRAADRG